jgi:hypothetical protein
MTAGALFAPALTKEFRALLPAWAASALVIAAALLANESRLFVAALMAYGLGVIALGAQSIGHEYSHRTMGLLLSQPSDRRRLFLMKLGALTVMLLALTAMAWPLLQDTATWRRSFREPNVLVVAAVSGLFLTPCLTLLSRSTLAGIVFSVAVPGILLIVSDIIGVLIYGAGRAAEIDRFKFAFFWRVMAGVWALAAAGSWWMFMRLEAIEGRGAEFHLPRPMLGAGEADAAPVRHHNPVVLLIAKELRIQQMTFVVATLFALFWLSASWLERTSPDGPQFPFEALTLLYVGLTSLLIGALASAEERQLGTVEWQILLPMAAWQQWIVKVGVAALLGLALGAALPVVLALAAPTPDMRLTAHRIGTLLLVVSFLTAAGIYVSSLVSSGVKALVLSLPILCGLFIFVQSVMFTLWWAVERGILSPSTKLPGFPLPYFPLPYEEVAGFVPLLLWLAFLNHRSAQRGLRLWKQGALLLGYVALVVALRFDVGFWR